MIVLQASLPVLQVPEARQQPIHVLVGSNTFLLRGTLRDLNLVRIIPVSFTAIFAGRGRECGRHLSLPVLVPLLPKTRDQSLRNLWRHSEDVLSDIELK